MTRLILPNAFRLLPKSTLGRWTTKEWTQSSLSMRISTRSQRKCYSTSSTCYSHIDGTLPQLWTTWSGWWPSLTTSFSTTLSRVSRCMPTTPSRYPNTTSLKCFRSHKISISTNLWTASTRTFSELSSRRLLTLKACKGQTKPKWTHLDFWAGCFKACSKEWWTLS